MLGLGNGLGKRKKKGNSISTIATDAFTRSNSTTTLGNSDTGQPWFYGAEGLFGIATNEAYKVTDGSGADYAYMITGVTVGSVRVDIKYVTGKPCGLLVRESNNTNFITALVTPTGLVLAKRVSGTDTTLGTYAFTPVNATKYNVKAVLRADGLDVYLDSVLRLQTSDLFNITQTKHGVRSPNIGVTFDNFIVETYIPVAPKTVIMAGAWMGEWPNSVTDNVVAFNTLSNHHSDIIHTFVEVPSQDLYSWGFMNYVKTQGAINLLTFMLHKLSDGSDYSTVDVNSGILDTYFATIANQLKVWQGGSEIWIRLMHEFNASFYGWGIGGSVVNTNSTYQQAFQRIVNIFRANGANNVKFVYNVNNNNDGAGSSFMGAYPGDAYVDYLSIDGYNWGTAQVWASWQSFRDVFDTPYAALVAGSNKPVIIAEIGCTELGGNKANWINDMKQQIQSGAYPKIVASVWFNQNVPIHADWRINTTTDSLTAYQAP